MSRIRVFIDYPIKDSKEFMGLTFPQVLHDYLKKNDVVEIVNEFENPDVIVLISGGSHYSHLNIRKDNFMLRALNTLKKNLRINDYSKMMERNNFYENRVESLRRNNPDALFVHRLDSRYRNLCKVYGYDESVKIINQYADISIYQTKFGQDEYEKGFDSIFGFQVPNPMKNAVLIYNGVDREVFSSFGDRFQWEGEINIIHVATTGMVRKGLGKVLEIAYLLRDNPKIHFYLVGRQEQDPIYGRDIQKFPNVHKLPHTTDRYLLAKYYRSADVLLYPTIDDCSPNVVLEAMSCGLCVLAANSGGTPELILKEDIQGGLLLNEANPIYSLKELINNLDKFKTAAINLIEKYHSSTVMGDQYLEVFKKCIVKEKSR